MKFRYRRDLITHIIDALIVFRWPRDPIIRAAVHTNSSACTHLYTSQRYLSFLFVVIFRTWSRRPLHGSLYLHHFRRPICRQSGLTCMHWHFSGVDLCAAGHHAVPSLLLAWFNGQLFLMHFVSIPRHLRCRRTQFLNDYYDQHHTVVVNLDVNCYSLWYWLVFTITFGSKVATSTAVSESRNGSFTPPMHHVTIQSNLDESELHLNRRCVTTAQNWIMTTVNLKLEHDQKFGMQHCGTCHLNSVIKRDTTWRTCQENSPDFCRLQQIVVNAVPNADAT